MIRKATILALCAFSACVFGQDNQSKRITIPDTSRSPDHRFGVTVPVRDFDDEKSHPPNKLVEIKSGRVLAVLAGETGWTKMNHGGVLPARWSRDCSLLLWEVDGKWFPNALDVVKIEKDEVKWQTDILKAAQEAILARTKAATPQKYAAAKKANAGNGSAYADGFSIDVEALDPIALPLRVRVALTSNPKQIPGPDMVTLESKLEATVDVDGKFVVQSFGLGPGKSRHF